MAEEKDITLTEDDKKTSEEIEQALSRVMARVEEDRKKEQEEVLNQLKSITSPAPTAAGQLKQEDDLPNPELEFSDYMTEYRKKVATDGVRASAAMLQYAQIAREDADRELSELVESEIITEKRKSEILSELNKALLDEPNAVVHNVNAGHHLSFVARLTHEDLVKHAKEIKKKALSDNGEPFTGSGTGPIGKGGIQAGDPRLEMAKFLKDRGYDLDPDVKTKWEGDK